MSQVREGGAEIPMMLEFSPVTSSLINTAPWILGFPCFHQSET